MAGKRVLVTAGPTRERWDAVRYFSNYSSGRMGYALAAAARKAGAKVTLVSGAAVLPAPAGVKLVRVESAREMHREVFRNWRSVEILLMVAAVADYRPRRVIKEKLKKGEELSLALVRNPDILAECGKRKAGRYLVGFAAESSRMVTRAVEKLRSKRLDCIVANRVGGRDGAMGGTSAQVTMLFSDGRKVPLAKGRKEKVAEKILEEVAKAIKLMG